MTFRDYIEALRQLRNTGKRNTPEYLVLLDKAEKANPSSTPIGFYLTD